jgi:hypothetical protein
MLQAPIRQESPIVESYKSFFGRNANNFRLSAKRAPLSPSSFFPLAAWFFSLSLSFTRCWPGQRVKIKIWPEFNESGDMPAQNYKGASIFWVRRMAAFGGEDNAAAFWQGKRNGERRGIVEVISYD